MSNLLERNGNKSRHSNDDWSSPIATTAGNDLFDARSLAGEMVKSGRDENISGARVRSRRLTGLDLTLLGDFQTLEITRVQSSRMVSTGSWSSPRVDSSVIGSRYRESKTRVNNFHIAPRNRVTGNGINNLQSLIKDEDFRFMHKDVKGGNSRCCPSARDHNDFGLAGEKRFDNQTKKDKAHKEKSTTASATSEKFTIGMGLFCTLHKSRLSQVRRVCLV